MRKQSVICQLETICKTLQDLEYYECDVSGIAFSDAPFYSKLQDQIKEHLKSIQTEVEN